MPWQQARFSGKGSLPDTQCQNENARWVDLENNLELESVNTQGPFHNNS